MDPDPVPDLAALRAEYELGGLDEADLAPDPVTMFERWIAEARSAGLLEVNAMVLATVGSDGVPSSRTVLLKGVGPDGFVFYSNYGSRKGADLDAEPRCSLLFGWYALQRQVRVEGVAAKVPRAETEAYFASGRAAPSSGPGPPRSPRRSPPGPTWTPVTPRSRHASATARSRLRRTGAGTG